MEAAAECPFCFSVVNPREDVSGVTFVCPTCGAVTLTTAGTPVLAHPIAVPASSVRGRLRRGA